MEFFSIELYKPRSTKIADFGSKILLCWGVKGSLKDPLNGLKQRGYFGRRVGFFLIEDTLRHHFADFFTSFEASIVFDAADYVFKKRAEPWNKAAITKLSLSILLL